MMLRPRVGVAVVGLGMMGRVHVHNLAQRIAAAELGCVADAVADTAAAVGRHYGARWTTSYEAVLEDDEIDAVVIATPSPLHASMIELAASAGKHVFCEKPVGLSLEPTLVAIQCARSADVLLQIGFHRRFDPDYQVVRQRIADGQLGDVFFVRTAARDKWTSPAESKVAELGHYLVDSTIHDMDTLRWLVGEIEEVNAHGAAVSDPGFAAADDVDHIVVVVRFANGGLGVIDNSRVAGYGFECSTEIIGSAAAVRIGFNHSKHDVEWLADGLSSRETVATHIERHPVAYLLEIDGFVEAVRGGDVTGAGGDDAVAAFMLCEGAKSSLETGAPVRLRPTAVGEPYPTFAKARDLASDNSVQRA